MEKPARKAVPKGETLVSLTPKELEMIKLGLGRSMNFTRVSNKGVIRGQKYVPNPEPKPVERFPTLRKAVEQTKEGIRNTGRERYSDGLEESMRRYLREEIEKVGSAEGFDEEEMDKLEEEYGKELDQYYHDMMNYLGKI
jgi:hypothetical protein